MSWATSRRRALFLIPARLPESEWRESEVPAPTGRGTPRAHGPAPRPNFAGVPVKVRYEK
jgi:hypothetical protein